MASIRHGLRRVKDDLQRHGLLQSTHAPAPGADRVCHREDLHGAERRRRASVPLAWTPGMACRWDQLFDARHTRASSELRAAVRTKKGMPKVNERASPKANGSVDWAPVTSSCAGSSRVNGLGG